MKRIILLFGTLLIASMLFACAPKVKLVAPVEPVAPVTKVGWEAEWERTLAEAKKEGRLSIYSTVSAEIRGGLQEAFKEKYGIALEFAMGRSAEIQQKIFSEYSAGLHLVDMTIQGGSTILFYKDRNLLERLEPVLILPEVKDDKAWFEGRLPFLDKEGYTVAMTASGTGQAIVNTNMVRKDEIRFARDLLNPKWKGKIVMDDPTTSGPGNQQMIVSMVLHGVDFVRELVKQQPILLRDSRQLAEWVARGKYAVGIAPRTEVAGDIMKAGAPIVYQIIEDNMYLSSSSANIGLFKKAPHPSAAKIFSNWLLSREGQTVYSKHSNMHTARVDVDASLADPAKRRTSDIKYYEVISEEYIYNVHPKNDALIRDIFAPLLR